MLIEFNRKSSAPIVREVNEGCSTSDAWLLLQRMKTFSAQRHIRSLDFMDTTPWLWSAFLPNYIRQFTIFFSKIAERWDLQALKENALHIQISTIWGDLSAVRTWDVPRTLNTSEMWIGCLVYLLIYIRDGQFHSLGQRKNTTIVA